MDWHDYQQEFATQIVCNKRIRKVAVLMAPG